MWGVRMIMTQQTVVSGQKQNKVSQLSDGVKPISVASGCKTHEIWILSKIETDNICNLKCGAML